MKSRDEEILSHIHQSLTADFSCWGLGLAEPDVGRVYWHVQVLGRDAVPEKELDSFSTPPGAAFPKCLRTGN